MAFWVFMALVFLSTPSVRRATAATLTLRAQIEFLSTPSVRRATRPDEAARGLYTISIHALREEGDDLRRRHNGGGGGISIHALREEGDSWKGVLMITP